MDSFQLSEARDIVVLKKTIQDWAPRSEIRSENEKDGGAIVFGTSIRFFLVL
jgi:hypothetical protein